MAVKRDTPRKCPVCKRAYQIKNININSNDLTYLDDFPKYGLESVICKECKKKNE